MPSRRAVLGSLAVTAAGGIAGCGTRTAVETDWRRAAGDDANTGRGPDGPQPPLSVEWEHVLPEDRAVDHPSPVIADGEVYVATRQPRADTTHLRVVVLDAVDGSLLRETTVTTYDEPTTSSRLLWDSLVVTDRGVYVLAFDGLYALNNDLDRRWHVDLGGGPTTTVLASGQPAVADGVVYAATASTTDRTDGAEAVLALDAASGERRWTHDVQTSEHGWTFPPALADGTCYVSALDAGLLALDAQTGLLRWQASAAVNGPPTIADGTVFCSTDGGDADDSSILAVDADSGRELWRTEGGGSRLGRRVAVGDERLYHRASLDAVVARDPETGAERWRATQYAPFAGGSVVTDDYLYATVSTPGRDRDDGVAVFDPETGEVVSLAEITEAGLDTPLAVTDSLVVTNVFGTVTALGTCSLPHGDRCLFG